MDLIHRRAGRLQEIGVAANSLPWMPWFPGDFLSSSKVQRMSLAEQGAYRRLLDFQWMDGLIPSDPEEIARLLGVPIGEANGLWRRIGQCFEPCDGGLINRRLDQHRRKSISDYENAVESGKRGANIRWGKNRDPIGDPNATPIAIRTTTRTRDRTTSPTPPSEGVGLSEPEKRNGSNGRAPWKPRHPETAALADYHARAVRHWKPDANVSSSSVRSLRGFDALLLTDKRDFGHTKEILAWIFRGNGGDYEPRGEFDWRPNLLSGDSVRRAWDKLDVLFNKALEPHDESGNGHFRR